MNVLQYLPTSSVSIVLIDRVFKKTFKKLFVISTYILLDPSCTKGEEIGEGVNRTRPTLILNYCASTFTIDTLDHSTN